MSETTEPPSGVDLIKAALAGAQARAKGAEVTTCPYRPDAPVQRERLLASLWINGYNRGASDS